ncbi:uncharacterized protein [Asterias amurensis]|uniref:uncharacterized protein n=1 Tax=Asterias amurensis TaxID=7602 RepID=UPI003AB640F4
MSFVDAMNNNGGDNHDSDNDSGMEAAEDDDIEDSDSNITEFRESPHYALRITSQEFQQQTRDTRQAVNNLVQSQEYQMWFNKCSTCHISWYEGRFTYGCEECGGFALKRPCPICTGKCQAIWTRETEMSHKMRLAHWDGDCRLPEDEKKVYFIRNFVESSEDVLTDAMNDLCSS